MNSRTISNTPVELADGLYSGRLGGNTVTVKQESKQIKFTVNKSVGDVSIAVFVRVSNKKAIVTRK